MKRAIFAILALIVGAALAAPVVADQQAGEMTLDPEEAAGKLRGQVWTSDSLLQALLGRREA